MTPGLPAASVWRSPAGWLSLRTATPDGARWREPSDQVRLPKMDTPEAGQPYADRAGEAVAALVPGKAVRRVVAEDTSEPRKATPARLPGSARR